VQQSPTLNAALLVGAVLLLTVPLAIGPDVPPDRIEFYAEDDWSDYDGQENLGYADLTTDEQRAFENALAARPGTLNYTLKNAPDDLTPRRNGMDVYNVRYNGSWYLLQVKYVTYSADFLTQVFPRIVLGLGGIGLGLVAGYREFA
jgi:hypothetical protein